MAKKTGWHLLWEIVKWPLGIILVLGGISLLAWIILKYGYAAPWTGFNQTKIDNPAVYQPVKLLWDWLQLLIIPIFLTFAGWIYSVLQKQTDYKLAKEKENSVVLQAYFDSMKDLIVDGKLINTEANPEQPVRALARSKTITTLQMIDDERKKAVLNFLSHAGLIKLNQPIIMLDELELNNVNFQNLRLTFVDLKSIVFKSANLTKAKIENCNLSLADLSEIKARGSIFAYSILKGANFFHADLEGTDLSNADLVSANLQKARLKKSTLTSSSLAGAKLQGCNFSEAQLDSCDFSNYDDSTGGQTIIENTTFRKANLTRAQFRGVDFSHGVDFTDAVLDEANFSGATISRAEIDRAKSKLGVILP
jgi:uncharacterized protein YjbI with pentapeptide repeats